MEYITLNSGDKMPLLGMGVYQINNLKACRQTVETAIENGYRLFDTAQIYGNEAAVGDAIAESKIDRKNFFITTKIWVDNAAEEKAEKAILSSLKKLKTGYIDLLLIHQPYGDYYGAWRAMRAAKEKGLCRNIGVSNFYADRLVDLIGFCGEVPAVNQLETHPMFMQRQARKYMKSYNVAHQAWAPLAEGKFDEKTAKVLSKIGAAYGKTAAQTALKFLVQSKISAIPKACSPKHIAENIDIFDFTIADDDMAKIAALDKNKSAFFSHSDPETVKYLTGIK